MLTFLRCRLERLDPSIRLTYHPLAKKTTQTAGFNLFSPKVVTRTYTQRILVHNSKPISVSSVNILDHIPISEDDRIDVKIKSPRLNMPGQAEEKEKNSTLSSATGLKALSKEVQVQKGVVAKWDVGNGEDEDEVAAKSLGKDGKVRWVVELAPQEKITLVLNWEVTLAANLRLSGL